MAVYFLTNLDKIELEAKLATCLTQKDKEELIRKLESAEPMELPVKVSEGGTGATTAAEALSNLGAAPIYTYSTEDITAGETALENGKLYLVYE